MRRALPFVLLAACGGRVEHAPPEDAASDVAFHLGDIGVPDNGVEPIDAPGARGVCPPEPPSSGDSCSHEKDGWVDCTYGDQPVPKCRMMASCGTAGFGVYVPDCPKVACPPTAPMTGSACTRESICGWADGTLCECAYGELRWRCYAPPTDPRCPRLSPNAGTRCDVEALGCDYGNVGRCRWGAAVLCLDGAWSWQRICVGP